MTGKRLAVTWVTVPWEEVPDNQKRPGMAANPEQGMASLHAVRKVLAAHGLITRPDLPAPEIEAARASELDLSDLRSLCEKYGTMGPTLVVVSYATQQGIPIFAKLGSTCAVRVPLDRDIGRPPLWHRLMRAAVRALLSHKLGDASCDWPTCITCGERYWDGVLQAADIAPASLCTDCRNLVGHQPTADRLAELAHWIHSNNALSMARVGKERLSRIHALCEMGDHGVLLNNQVLLAHAEKVQLGATKLGTATYPPHPAKRVMALVEARDPLPPVKASESLLLGLVESVGAADGAALAAGVQALIGLTPYVDSALHATTKRGRDHATHMAATALFSQFLGDTVCPGRGGKRVEMRIADHAARNTNGELEYSQWCLAIWFAGMLHDVAYPFSEFMQIWHLAETASVSRRGRAPVLYKAELEAMLNALAEYVLSQQRSPAANAVRDSLVAILDPAPQTNTGLVDRAKSQLLHQLCVPRYLRHEGLVEEIIASPRLSHERERPFLILNHGLLSALICLAALRGSGFVSRDGDVPMWLRYGLQAIAVHDYEIHRHQPRSVRKARSVRAPVGSDGGPDAQRQFVFEADPVSFVLRLADKVHHWERYVRGQYAFAEECEEIMLHGLLWRLPSADRGDVVARQLWDGSPRWVGHPQLSLVYGPQDQLDATGWDHKKVADDLRRYLAELPFPAAWGMPSGRLRFQTTLPVVAP